MKPNTKIYFQIAALVLLVMFLLYQDRTIPNAEAAVTITQSISNNATLSGSVTWTASPTGATISKVEFYIDNNLSWTENTGPYQYNGDPSGVLDTTTLSNGSHTLKSTATASDNSTASVTANVTVSNSVSPPPPNPPPPGPPPAFAYPVSVNGRKFIDQNGNPYLMYAMSSWAMGQNLSNSEITAALEGLKSDGFNAVNASPFGVNMNGTFTPYKNDANQNFFTGTPFASSFGPAWSSMDWLVSEATRLQMTVVFSHFLSWGSTGMTPELSAVNTTQAYNYGVTLANRYAAYPNIVWHIMGDFGWDYTSSGLPANLDAMFHGIKDTEGSTHRLIIAEPDNGTTSYTQFISEEGTSGSGYQWFRVNANTVYDYGNNAVDQFDTVWNQGGATTYPVFDIEPPYVNAPHYEGNQNQQLRERNYSTFIRGGVGINFGHEAWWPFGSDGLFDGGPGWMNILTQAPQLQAKYAWTFLDAYVKSSGWTRDNNTFLKTGLGSTDTKAASGYSNSSAVVYFPSNRSVTVDTNVITTSTNVKLRWYDPFNGTYTTIADSEAKSTNRSISYPAAHSDGTTDWVLVVEGATPDTQAPSDPTNLSTTVISSSQINLSWTASTDNIAVSGYNIYRDGVQVGTSPTPSYVNAGLSASTTYTFTVSAYDGSNNNSGLSSPISATTPSPGSITTPLHASTTNPNFFVDGSGKAVLLTGSHTWNTLQDWGNGTTNLDYDAFVNMMKTNNQNFTLLWRTELSSFCNLPTGAVTNYDVLQQPWQRTGPGVANDGKPKYDLTKFDQSFFDRLRTRALQLNSNGIYAGVYFFSGEWLNVFRCSTDGFAMSSGNNINGIADGGQATSTVMFAPNAITDFQDALVDKMIDTLNDLPNVLWIVSEEANGASDWWNAHLISHAKSYEATKPFQHPVGYGVEIDNTDSTLYNSNADWVAPAAHISPTSSCGTGTPTCKVNINDSDHSYFGMWNESAQANRNYFWENFMNGNSVVFMDPYVVYYPREGRNMCVNPVNGICSAPDNRWSNVRATMGYIRSYADRVNLIAMTGQPTLSSTGHVLANAAPTGAEYLVYTGSGGTFTVNLSATTRTLGVEWMNPNNGTKTTASSVVGGATRSFTPPFSGDAVLYLSDTGGITTYARTITIASLDGRNNKIVSGTLNVLTNPGKSLIKSFPFTTNSMGVATITFDITAQNVYLQIKAAPFLARVVAVDLNNNITYSVPQLMTGDINQDNIVNSIDFSTLNSKWFTSDAASDLNQDGLVNSLDFSLLNKNWFLNGES